MTIRPYTITDESAVLNLLNLNIPKYFAPSEYDDLVEYLTDKREDYFVLEIDGALVGAAGINYFPEEKTARLSWDFFNPDYQGKGLGSALTKYRIARIGEQPQYENIVVRTSQLAFAFYEKMGFKVTRTEVDYWAPGLDLYYMEMML